MEQKREWNHWNGLPRAEALEAHLAEMAAGGWQLAQAGPRLRYARSAPRAAAYAVTCPPGKRERDAADTPEAWEAAGWTPVCDHGVLRIYTADLPAPPRPDGTPHARLTMVRRTMELNGVWRIAALPFMAVVLLFLMMTAAEEPLETLSSLPALLEPPVWAVITVLLAVTIFRETRWLRRARKAVRDGQPCPPVLSQRRLLAAMLALIAAMTLLRVIHSIQAGDTPWVFYLVCLVLLALVRPQWGADMSPQEWGVRGLAVVVLVILSVAAIAWRPLNPHETSPDQLPLGLQDVGLPGAPTMASAEVTASPLLSYGRYWVTSTSSSLQYEVCRTPLPSLGAFCTRTLMDDRRSWRPGSGPADWVAETEHVCYYLLADGDTVALLYTGVETPLDDGQLAAAAAALGIS